LAVERKAAHRKEDLELHFKEFSDTIMKYGIESADIYNMDETGFRIGVIAGRVVITHLSTKAVYLADPDNRESITAVKTVCADCSTIPPMLILKGDVLRNISKTTSKTRPFLPLALRDIRIKALA
jgi:hypothetical protein